MECIESTKRKFSVLKTESVHTLHYINIHVLKVWRTTKTSRRHRRQYGHSLYLNIVLKSITNTDMRAVSVKQAPNKRRSTIIFFSLKIDKIAVEVVNVIYTTLKHSFFFMLGAVCQLLYYFTH